MHVSFTNLAPEAWNPDNAVSGYAGIPRNMTTVAQKMQQAGYATAMTGKWDVGMATTRHTPKGRGYEHFLGYFHHANDYWTEGVPITAIGEINVCLNQFTDLWHNDGPAHFMASTGYEEDLFLAHTLTLLDQHNASVPLFLFHSFHLIHTPLQIPPLIEALFYFISDKNRRLYASMVYYMDVIVGSIVDKLKQKKMYDNTLIVSFSDNGGPIYVPGSANNYPLYGGKYADFEGGVRTNAFVSGGALPAARRGQTLVDLVHISDWYATFVHLANFGMGPADKAAMQALLYDEDAASAGLPQVDSMDAWPVIANLDDQSGKRTSIYLSPQSYLSGQYKVVVGNVSQSIWQGPFYPNETSTVLSGRTCLYSDYPGAVDACYRDCGAGCLFNVFTDPTEHHDLAAEMPDLLGSMVSELASYNLTIFDPDRGSPSTQACIAAFKYGGFYGPFVDV